MRFTSTKSALIDKLQKDILQWQGFSTPGLDVKRIVNLGDVEIAFPNAIFPIGAIHEFVCNAPDEIAASGGFIAGILSMLMQANGICVWVRRSQTVYPPALRAFGVHPDNVIFIHLQREKDVLWVMEEALKCEGLTAVIGELQEISFTSSRRFQLVVEQSKVTGFIVRHYPRSMNATTCAARWNITPVASQLHNDMPGVGFPRWKVELLKVRNGNPGSWTLEWSTDKFTTIREPITVQEENRKAG